MAITLNGLMNDPKELRNVSLQFSEAVPAPLLEHLYNHLKRWCESGWPVYPDMTPLHCTKCDWKGYDPSETVNQCPECGCKDLEHRVTFAPEPTPPSVKVHFDGVRQPGRDNMCNCGTHKASHCADWPRCVVI